MLEQEFDQAKTEDWRQLELQESWLFIEEKARVFSARDQDRANLLQSITCGEAPLLLLQGPCGSGKSTLMAKLAKDLSQADNKVLPIICGRSAGSATALDIMRQMVYFLEDLLGVTEHLGDIEPLVPAKKPSLPPELENWAAGFDARLQKHITLSPDTWRMELTELLHRYQATGKPRLIVLVDAVDQLFADELRDGLLWLPTEIPCGIKILISCLDSFSIPSGLEVCYWLSRHTLAPLTKQDSRLLIQRMAQEVHQELSDVVLEKLLQMPEAENPFYLSTMAQRLLMLNSNVCGKDDSFLCEVIDRSPADLDGICALLMEEAAEQIGQEQTMETLWLLAVSRTGLRESDLCAIYSKLQHSFSLQKLMKKEQVFSLSDFARLRQYMRPYFTERSDGRIDFIHLSIPLGILKSMEPSTLARIKEGLFRHLEALPNHDSLHLELYLLFALKLKKNRNLARRITTYSAKEMQRMALELCHLCRCCEEYVLEWIVIQTLYTNRSKVGAESWYDLLCQFLNLLNPLIAKEAIYRYLIAKSIIDELNESGKLIQKKTGLDEMAQSRFYCHCLSLMVSSSSQLSFCADKTLFCCVCGIAMLDVLAEGDPLDQEMMMLRAGFHLHMAKFYRSMLGEPLETLNLFNGFDPKLEKINAIDDAALRAIYHAHAAKDDIAPLYERDSAYSDAFADALREVSECTLLLDGDTQETELKLAELALKIHLDFPKKGVEYLTSTAALYATLSRAHWANGNLGQAFHYGHLAVYTQENAIAPQWQSLNGLLQLANLYIGLADFYLDQEEYETALSYEQKALPLYQKLNQTNEEAPDIYEKLAFCFGKIAEALFYLGRLEEGLPPCVECIQRQQRLMKICPKNRNYDQYERFCQWYLYGWTTLEQDVWKLISFFENELEAVESIQKESSSAQNQKAIAQLCNYLGKLYLSQRAMGLSLEMFTRSRDEFMDLGCEEEALAAQDELDKLMEECKDISEGL